MLDPTSHRSGDRRLQPGTGHIGRARRSAEVRLGEPPESFPATLRLVPRRLQRSRRAGARLPVGTVVVTRPTRWGNPHGLDLGREEAVRRYRDDLLAGRLLVTVEDVRRELRGRDLACYCPLDEPCHADVLIAIADSER